MRYEPTHKARVHARIVQVAGRLFRRHGYDGVGIDRIMNTARLTRGGFYGHFRSKAALFAAALREEHGLVRLLRARRGKTEEALRRQARTIVADYLRPSHRREVGLGCYLAASSTDVARSGPAAKRAYASVVDDVARELARGLPGGQARDSRALATIALMVGGLTVARATDDDELATAVLRAADRAAQDQLSRSR